LHAAGTTRDSLLRNKTGNEFHEVIAPKVLGTLCLDEGTCGEPIELFVLFSSISAEFGNVGQTDYAYANSFLDHFAHHRETLRQSGQRHGQTISINWPLWADGGIHVDEQTRRFMEQTLGMKPLTKELGTAVFEQCIQQDTPQVMVLFGDASRLNARFLADRNSTQEN
jgi:KR domain